MANRKEAPSQAGWHPPGPPPSFGIIITNRDRSRPLEACLGSLAVQDTPPAWVMLSDLGSREPHQAALAGLAERYGASYLRIDHDGAWNKSLAFNTAFRLALRTLPAVSHIIQLDADMILHPCLLSRTAAEVRRVSCFWCAPRPAPRELEPPAPGDMAGFERMLAECGPTIRFAVGVFLVVPCGWLASQRGFDEAFTGWGLEDTELWWRARYSLTHGEDTSGRLLIHQWHQPQPAAGDCGQNWPLFVHRIANPAETNPSGWGNGPVTASVLRSGPLRAPRPDGVPSWPLQPA